MSKQLYYNTVKLYINYSKSIMNMLPNYIQASIYSNRELTFIINKNYNKLVLNFLKKYLRRKNVYDRIASAKKNAMCEYIYNAGRIHSSGVSTS